MNDIAIRVGELSKKFHIGRKLEKHKTLRDTLADAFVSPFRRAGKLLRGHATGASELDETIWALKNVSFEIKQGEVVGIIGRNGAGKSTLLKILSRITEPTKGFAEIHGRVGSLLEVGTGFHPELTGRENIYLNGAILGMKRTEIDQKFDEIVDFSEVERFIDTPVKHYSSGMYLRLAFAVAAHLEPEILLVDEVLAVGDASFQKKCLGKMRDVAKKGRTVLFVSHNIGAISALCPTCIYLEQGCIKGFAPTNEVIRQYLEAFKGAGQTLLADRTDRNGDGRVRITNLRFLDAKTRRPIEVVISGQDICIEVAYKSQEPSHACLERVNIGLSFFNALGQFVMVLNSQMANSAFETLPPEGLLYCLVPRFPLMVGDFSITLALAVSGSIVDMIENAMLINVETGDFFGTGITNVYGRQGVYVPHRWVTEL